VSALIPNHFPKFVYTGQPLLQQEQRTFFEILKILRGKNTYAYLRLVIMLLALICTDVIVDFLKI